MEKNKKKKKLTKKAKIIILVIALVLIILLSIFLIVRKATIKVELKKTTVNINDKVYTTDLIKKVHNGTVVSSKEKINTKKTGKKKVDIRIKNKFNKIIKYKYTVNVIDKEKPKIKVEDKITIEQGTEIDIIKQIEVTDNSKELIIPKVEGEYDINTPGTYELTITAIDSNKNKTTKKITLEVIEKQQTINNGTDNKTFKTSKGYTVKVVDGISYINGIMIVNKSFSIPANYNPGGLTGEFNSAFSTMQQAAKTDGIGIWVISGFRSYNTQNNLYNNYAARDGYAAADTYSARPGHSEHQTGLAADINVIDDDFGKTPEGKWLHDNAHKYGFILRYPEGKTGETGYKYEPWHFRYVGTDLAGKLYNGGNWITMEDYYGITSQYS